MDVVTARPTELDRYAGLARTTGIIGIAFLVLLFGPIIALASADEPALEATAAEAVKYFGNLEARWAQLTMAASTLGMIGSLWFFVAFGFLLRRAEGDPPWRSAIATLSGALLAAFGLIGVSSVGAASLHGGRITPEVADYAYTFGNVGFANVWIAPASFAVCSGWVILSTGVLERWMGWWIVVAGLCLVVARFAWTAAGFWGVGYALFWLWIIVVCIRLIVPVEQRRTLRSAALALDRPGVHEADVAPGAGRYPWPMARPTPAQRHRLIGEEGERHFRVDPAARTLVA